MTVMFPVCTYPNLYDTKAHPSVLDIHELVRFCKAPVKVGRLADKKMLPMWSPVRLNVQKRAKKNVAGASCLVLDYDDNTDLDGAMAIWGQWYSIYYSTWSHTRAAPRFRVVLPLAREVTPGEYPTLWRWAEMTANRQIDKACKDISRAWARFAVPDTGSDDAFAEHAWGHLLDPNKVIPLAPPLPEPVRPRKTINLQQLSQQYAHLAHLHLDPDSRAELGHHLGGVVNDDCVKLVECPRCKRNAVWWWLDPTLQIDAFCNHRQSCGWRGPVAALIPDENTASFDALEQ